MIMKQWLLSFIAIALLGTLYSCGGTPLRIPSLSASPGRPALQTDGAILINGGNLLTNHQYGVGIFTGGSPVKIGEVTTDGTGAINNVKLEYPCRTLFVGRVNVEVYELQPDKSLGAGIVQTQTNGDTCF
jgi:hypothetical protein